MNEEKKYFLFIFLHWIALQLDNNGGEASRQSNILFDLFEYSFVWLTALIFCECQSENLSVTQSEATMKSEIHMFYIGFMSTYFLKPLFVFSSFFLGLSDEHMQREFR